MCSIDYEVVRNLLISILKTNIYSSIKNYKDNFSIKESLNDFEKYENRLNDLRKNFLTKYQELIYKKIINNEIEKESL